MGRRMTSWVFSGSDPGDPWNKGCFLEPHGFTEELMILGLGQKQGVCVCGGGVQLRGEVSSFYLSGRLFNLFGVDYSDGFFVHSCYKWKDWVTIKHFSFLPSKVNGSTSR